LRNDLASDVASSSDDEDAIHSFHASSEGKSGSEEFNCVKEKATLYLTGFVVLNPREATK